MSDFLNSLSIIGNELGFLTEEDSGSLGPHGVSAASIGVSALAQDLYHLEITSRGLPAFDGLPLPRTLIPVSGGEPTTIPAVVKFEMQTLPVDARAIPDGDTITVYVSTAEPRESACVPGDVQMAAVQISEARAEGNRDIVDALHEEIINAGYRVINLPNNEEVLARKYRIRLRGIDAPESSMPYGKEAKNELIKIVQGKCLRVLVYGEDRYGRCVADLYCDGIFVQELMLKKGCAWHYSAYDQHLELANWEKEAQAQRVGLWAKSPPAEEAARLVIQSPMRHQKTDVEGLMGFYGLPLPQTLIPVSSGKPIPALVKFEMQTLPVDARAIPDGDTITVYVSTAEPRESACVPGDVQMAAVQRLEAQAERIYEIVDALHEEIINAGYRVINLPNNKEVLARKYRIRLRGIDAPESSMPYGKEAKNELIKIVQGKCLRVLVYGKDRYGRSVADLYCDGIFVQELMLKKGCAWHYSAYDQRLELANWEKEARAKRVGLWAAPNPEEPWEWRKDRREGR